MRQKYIKQNKNYFTFTLSDKFTICIILTSKRVQMAISVAYRYVT